MSLTIVMVADIPSGAAEGLQAYESAVLPLLPGHGGRLERRLRTGDALTEVHIVSFESQEDFESYLADAERQSHTRMLDGLDVAQRVLRVDDVQVPSAGQPPLTRDLPASGSRSRRGLHQAGQSQSSFDGTATSG